MNIELLRISAVKEIQLNLNFQNLHYLPHLLVQAHQLNHRIATTLFLALAIPVPYLFRLPYYKKWQIVFDMLLLSHLNISKLIH